VIFASLKKDCIRRVDFATTPLEPIRPFVIIRKHLMKYIKTKTFAKIVTTTALAMAAVATMRIAPSAIAAPKKVPYGQQGAGKLHEVRINAAEREELQDLFYMMDYVWTGGYFRNGNVKNVDLSELAFYGCRSLPSSKHVSGASHYTTIVSAKSIEQFVYKYFGKKIRHQSFKKGDLHIAYARGYYHVYGDGDPDERNAAVLKLFSLGNNYYQAYATYYDDDKSVEGKAQMKLKKVATNGKARFIIIDYLK
jgi:hypothetical protein